MFGTGNGWIGHHYFFLQDVAARPYGDDRASRSWRSSCSSSRSPTRAARSSSGAMVGRTAFGGDLLYSIAVSGFIYPIFGHWIWGPGRLARHDGHAVP